MGFNKYWVLVSCVIILLVNVTSVHFFKFPAGLIVLPVIVAVMCYLINFNTERFNIFLQIIFSYILIASGDIGIKLYGGGIHDSEGQGVVNLLGLTGALFCFIILIIVCFYRKENIFQKVISLVLFASIISLHFYFFADLGMASEYK